MMKKIISIVLLAVGIPAVAQQQQLFIPDTLSGPTYNLTLKHDSVPFFTGNYTQTYGFNAYSYFGPTLLLNKGSNVSMVVDNQLSDTTTLHWHGLHVSSVNDGGPHTTIMPGATWNPQFTVLDKASTYWYHPHLHMKTALHALRGAAGMIIVRDPQEAVLNLPRTYGVDDFPIAVQSHEFDTLNQINPRGMQDSILLVNGTLNPYVDLPAQVVRLRLLNASGERTFNFGFTNSLQFYVVGNDGGLLPAPVPSTRIWISPGERAEVLLDLSAMNGQTIHLMSYASELPTGVQGGPTMPMPSGPPMNSPLNGVDFNILQINVVPPTANPVTAIPTSLVPATPYTEPQANITRSIVFNADSMMVMDGPFYFNGQSFDMMRIDQYVPLNSIEIWELTNQTMVAHPFHIHDVQFYILDKDGLPPAPVESGRKDVVLVKSMETVRFITKFEDFTDTVVPYMYHCHILMHEDDGMMGQFLVGPSEWMGIEEAVVNSEMDIYPNPASDEISIDAEGFDNSKPVSMKVYDSVGKLVYSIDKDPQDMKLNIREWSRGLYTIVLMQDKKLKRGKVIVD